jgi:hypothetical protein
MAPGDALDLGEAQFFGDQPQETFNWDDAVRRPNDHAGHHRHVRDSYFIAEALDSPLILVTVPCLALMKQSIAVFARENVA